MLSPHNSKLNIHIMYSIHRRIFSNYMPVVLRERERGRGVGGKRNLFSLFPMWVLGLRFDDKNLTFLAISPTLSSVFLNTSSCYNFFLK